MNNIKLSAQDIIALLFEKPVKKEDLKICPNFSFLSVMALLNDKMAKDQSNARKRKV